MRVTNLVIHHSVLRRRRQRARMARLAGVLQLESRDSTGFGILEAESIYIALILKTGLRSELVAFTIAASSYRRRRRVVR